ncbi:MAG: response regulator [Desulfuromonadales bacterium]|nr:response regulator [Desulfuromonadales bacterium]
MMLEQKDTSAILIVEDQQDVQKLLEISLQKHGRPILHAYDAVQGWQMIRAEQPGVVLLDIMMPGSMDGMDLLRMIRKDRQFNKTVVIVMSALTQRSDFVNALAAGADDFLSKPFHLRDLHRLLEHYSTIPD